MIGNDMSDLKDCPACGSDAIVGDGHVIRTEYPIIIVTTGPECLECGFWSARGDWTPEQNIAGWNNMARPA